MSAKGTLNQKTVRLYQMILTVVLQPKATASIASSIGMSASRTSNHLYNMRDIGLVKSSPVGKDNKLLWSRGHKSQEFLKPSDNESAGQWWDGFPGLPVWLDGPSGTFVDRSEMTYPTSGGQGCVQHNTGIRGNSSLV